MEEEVWKKVEGFPNYSVSSYGNVRNDKFGWPLKGGLLNVGYYSIGLRKEGHNRYFNQTIHRLVASAFCDNPNNYDDVDHIDGIRTNNHHSNLRWTTRSQNLRNKKKKEGTSSRFIGITYDKSRKKWQAKFCVNYKIIHVGRFNTEEEAKEAWRSAIMKYGLQHFCRDFNDA